VSIEGAEGVIAPATNAWLTVTISAGEHCEAGWYAESFTKYAYVVVTEGAVTYVDEVAPDIARLQVPSEYH
jgi:nicotinamide mononucleotide (NMN) deamidase PncC